MGMSGEAPLSSYLLPILFHLAPEIGATPAENMYHCDVCFFKFPRMSHDILGSHFLMESFNMIP